MRNNQEWHNNDNEQTECKCALPFVHCHCYISRVTRRSNTRVASITKLFLLFYMGRNHTKTQTKGVVVAFIYSLCMLYGYVFLVERVCEAFTST